MSQTKKAIRENFRNSVFKRDKYLCKVCLKASEKMDAHHVTSRDLMPSGGYVKENGISLCPECHLKAEIFHSTGTALPDWHPNDLYKLINSSYEKAYKASEKL